MQRVQVRLVRGKTCNSTHASELKRISRSAAKSYTMVFGELLCMYCVLQGDDVTLITAAGLHDVGATVVDTLECLEQVQQLEPDHIRQGRQISPAHQGGQAQLGGRDLVHDLLGIPDPRFQHLGQFSLPLLCHFRLQLHLRWRHLRWHHG
jgi:hypothetical protein